MKNRILLLLPAIWLSATAMPVAAAVIYSDTFSTGLGNYTGSGTVYNSTAEDVSIPRSSGNYLALNAPLNFGTRGSQTMTIAFDFKFGGSMFGADYNIEYSNDGTTWYHVDTLTYSSAFTSYTAYSIDLNDGDSLAAGTFGSQTYTVGTVNLNNSSTFRIAIWESNPKELTVDNLVISDDVVPEPAVALLGSLGLLGLLRRKR